MSSQALVPAIRFKGFTDPWEQRKVSDIATIVGGGTPDTNNSAYWGGDIDWYAPAEMEGLIYACNSQRKITKEGLKNSSASMLPPNRTILFTSRAGIGKSAILTKKSCTNQGFQSLVLNDGFDTYFVYSMTGELKSKAESIASGSTFLEISGKMLGSIDIRVPKADEQLRIGKLFCAMDSLITLHQRKLDKIKCLKKALLEKMFPADGEDTPKIRFKGFADPWEQRKFRETVEIERGGSPRPIDLFITDKEDGLNWVKIGDAPSFGNKITSTEEKIRPEGLSKTRQVFPGDLILSNSMSFGKPYIMAINGCIHDGWLLIRNSQSLFNLPYLCVLLGTEGMLSQYRASAAGSTVNNLNKQLVGDTLVSIPTMQEQTKIGSYFETLDSLITLHQRKLEKLKNIKKFLLEKMFVS